ncbi:hypothetical protein [Yersinia phage vB_YenM_P778]
METKTDTAKFRELAHYTTKGRWWMDSHGENLIAFSGKGIKTVMTPKHSREKAYRDGFTGNLSHWNNDADASWITATQPENIIKLLDELDALRDDVLQVSGAIGLARSMLDNEDKLIIGILDAIHAKIRTRKKGEDNGL